MSTYGQFVQFGVDSFGLERTLRLLQSIAHILLSTTLLPAIMSIPDLLTIRSSLNLSRRTIRTFRFASTFSAMRTLYSKTPIPLETWLDVTRLTCLGIFGLLETVTIPDMAGVQVFGVEDDKKINLEAQKFWFYGLVFGILGGLLRLYTLEAEGAKGEKVVGKGEKGEQLKAKTVASKDKESKAEKAAVVDAKLKTAEKKRALVRKVVADAVDLFLPVATLGWVDIDPAVVGAAMFVSTVVSGYDVWKGVGVQMRGSKA